MNMRPSTTSKTAPRDARELVGKRDRQHIVMPPLLGYLDPRLEPVAFPSVRLHLHKRYPCCKYGTPRLGLISRMRHSCLVANVLPDMRNAGLTGVSRRKSTVTTIRDRAELQWLPRSRQPACSAQPKSLFVTTVTAKSLPRGKMGASDQRPYANSGGCNAPRSFR